MRNRRTTPLLLLVLALAAPLAAQQSAGMQSPQPDTRRAAPLAAPDALTAADGDTIVRLSWRPVAGADGYFVFRATNGVWDAAPVATITATTYTGTGLANGTRYAFAIAAYDAAGAGPFSATISVTPLTTSASTPEAGALTRNASVPETILLPAREAANRDAAGDAGQTIESAAGEPAPVRDVQGRASATAGSGQGAATPSAAAGGGTGLFAVMGVPQPPNGAAASADAAAPASASPADSAAAVPAPGPSATASVSPGSAASVPPSSPVTATPVAPSPRAPATSVAQSPPAAPGPPAESTPAASPAAMTDPASSAPSVAASPVDAVTPAVAPGGTPAGVTATTGDSRVVLSWQAVSGATGYLIYRATSGTWSPQPVGVAGTTSYTNTGLANGTLYAYKVAAYNGDGAGPQSAEVAAMPLAAPTGVKLESGDRQLSVTWHAADGATTYTVYRSTSTTSTSFVPVAANVSALSFVDSGLANGTRYYYRLRAFAPAGTSDMSGMMSAVPVESAPATAPANLTATPGNTRVALAWNAVPGATSYRVYRSTTGEFDRTVLATVTTTTFTNFGLTNGTQYSYRVVGRNTGGDGPFSQVAATPLAAPAAPQFLSATGADRRISVKWAPSPGAASYNLYRGTAPGAQGTTPYATGLSPGEFVDTVSNGPTYYYRVTAVNLGGESPRSAEVNAAGDGPPLVVDAATQAAYRLLRQATWGPRPGDVERVKQIGAAAFVDEQLAMAPSTFPDTLLTRPLEVAQEHFMQLALGAPDQLRQRVAWALHKIWVVSAVEVPSSTAIVTYYRLMADGAFGNYRDLMRAVTLNPAMGRYLNMLNNRSQHATGVPPNENYARELMQLFTLGVARLNPDGTPMLDGAGMPLPAYTEQDVAELARILTGWTFGDGNPATTPASLARENYAVPMEAVPALHDPAAKVFLGQTFQAHQSALQDVEQALDVLFNHPNVGPFVSRQLIQQLVTSNPSPSYVAAVAAVFNNPAARGDLRAVVRAILTHPEAGVVTRTSGKLAEPVLFVVATLRALGATATDYPFMSVYAEIMGQRVFYPPSVFSYYSPGFRVRGTNVGSAPPLGGPEFMLLTSVTALERANYVGALLAGRFGTDVAFDLSAFNALAADPGALVDYCNLVLLGGRMAPAERNEIVEAVRASSTTVSTERVRTAIYLTLVIASSQVDW